MLSFGIDLGTQSFCHSFIALLMKCCSKSAQKFAVSVCQVATVVMETAQLVLSQLKNFLLQSVENWIRYVYLSLPQIISKCCVLVKLCHINCSSPVFLRHTVGYTCHYACMCACLSVCMYDVSVYVPYRRPKGWADRHQPWRRDSPWPMECFGQVGVKVRVL